MPWFMDPVPDPDVVSRVGDTLRAVHTQHTDQLQRLQSTHDDTAAVWTGPASDGHTRSVAATQQVGQQHATWLIILADAFAVLGTLLRIIMVLMLAWLALQAATVIMGIVGFFTAGAGFLVAGDTEEAAIQVQLGIQAARIAVQTLLRALVSMLSQQLVQAGLVLGGAVGLGVGIKSAQDQHQTGWQAAGTIFGDTLFGAFDGATIAVNPIALVGTVIGVGEVTTSSAASGQPIDLQAAFLTISDDTYGAASAAGFADMLTPDVPADPQPVQLRYGDGVPVSGPEADAANTQLDALDNYRNDPANFRRGGRYPNTPQSAASVGTGSDQTFVSGYPPEAGPVPALPPNATRAGLGWCAEYKYVSYIAQHLDQLPPGDITVYEAQASGYDPCPSCRNAFQWLANNSGRDVTVYWRDGSDVFKWIFHPGN